MNYFVTAKLTGLLLAVFGTSMTPSLLWSLYERDGAAGELAAAMLITMAAGAGLYFVGKRREQEIFRREATVVVGLGWILSAAAGALPFYFADLEEMPTFTECFFESMSGLTTTGASVLTDIEAVPRGLLFWRSFTHWLGGLGIIMLFVAVLPYLGAGGRALVKSEVTGPVKEGLTPRIKDTARLLYRLYIGYTIVETILLRAVGMSWFDAMCHTFGSLGTGGFSTRNASVAAFDSFAVEMIIVVFMVLAGSNFALFYGVFRGSPLKMWKDREWRSYAFIIMAATLFITVNLLQREVYTGLGSAMRGSLFTVISILTTTGYVTADFETWPIASKLILFFLMFIGGCAGSTGGGLKVIRTIILIKIAVYSLVRIYRPNTVRKIRIGSAVLTDRAQQDALALFLLWMLVLIGGSFAVAVIERESFEQMIVPFVAAAATLNNIGPGFHEVGATQNYGFLMPASKWILCFLMLAGRLELYSILVLLVPSFWRK